MTRFSTGRIPPDKLGIVRDPMAAITWRATQVQACFLCGREAEYDLGRSFWLEVHHIVGGRGRRSDEFCNFLLVCQSLTDGCHRACTENNIDFETQCAAKELADPTNANRERLYQLKGYIPQ